MLKMRLQRRGKKNHATYRIVVAEHTSPVKGRFIDDLGYYNPHEKKFEVDADKVNIWIEKGVQTSPTVHNLLINNKVIKGDKKTSWRPKKKEGGEEEAAPVENTAEKSQQEEAPAKEA